MRRHTLVEVLITVKNRKNYVDISLGTGLNASQPTRFPLVHGLNAKRSRIPSSSFEYSPIPCFRDSTRIVQNVKCVRQNSCTKKSKEIKNNCLLRVFVRFNDFLAYSNESISCSVDRAIRDAWNDYCSQQDLGLRHFRAPVQIRTRYLADFASSRPVLNPLRSAFYFDDCHRAVMAAVCA